MEQEKINVNLEDWSTTEGLVIAPYISDFNQRTLIGIYLQELFAEDVDTTKYNYINAENALLLAMLELLTNINLTTENEEKQVALFTLNDVLANIGTVKEWLSSISNYADFKERLYETVEMVKEERRLEKSLGSVVDGLQSKILSVLDAFENLDADKIKDMLAELEKSTILKELAPMFTKEQQKVAKSE